MSRFYEGDGDNPIAITWHGNMRRILRSKSGQQKLRDFIEALLALPERRLIANAICRKGEVCAVAAYAKHKGVLDTSIDWSGDQGETIDLGKAAGLGFMLSWELGFMNDSEYRGPGFVRKRIVLDEPLLPDEHTYQMAKAYNNKAPAAYRFYDRRVVDTVYLDDGCSPEERWSAIYKWACRQVRWNLPVPA